MYRRQYPIATDQGTQQVTGYSWRKDSVLAVHRDGAQGPWIVTFLPVGTSISSLFGPERYMSAAHLLARADRIEETASFAWDMLAMLPWGQSRPIPEEYQFAVDAIKLAAAQP